MHYIDRSLDQLIGRPYGPAQRSLLLYIFLTNPAKSHLKAAFYLFRYLKGTKTFSPVYRRDPSLAPFPQVSNVLCGFADCDYVKCQDVIALSLQLKLNSFHYLVQGSMQ
jgi:hypothetical protein